MIECNPLNLNLKISHNVSYHRLHFWNGNIHYFMVNRKKEIKTFELVVNTQKEKNEQS